MATTTNEYKAYGEKEPTALHEAFAEWLTAKTGVKVDLKSVSLATVLHGQFQGSPENKARRAEAEEAAKAAVAAKKAAAAEKKAAAPAKKVAAKKTAAPAKKATVVSGGTAKKATPAKKKTSALKAVDPAF